MIFVSIASYRDKELPFTINSCLSKAKYPNEIKIGVCWQYDEEEDINQFDNDERILIEKIYWKDVKGSVCWARALIQEKFFTNEDYYLQIDSHTLFIQDWDEILINMLKDLPNRKSIISVGPSYYYKLEAEGGQLPHSLDKIDKDGDLFFDNDIKIQKLDDIGGTHFMYGFKECTDLEHPIKARHISAAYLFTIGEWVKDVPYDSNLYFHGEEPSITLRSFTNGYNIYNPNKHVLWHLKYHFPDRKRHWNTFDQSVIDELASKSNKRYLEIIKGIDLGKFGVGNIRTIKEWEIYSGVSFKDYVAHPSVFKGHIPDPNTIYDLDEWNRIKNRI